MPTFLARYSAVQIVHAAILLLLVIALAVQTVRIEGFKVWPLSHKGLKAQVSELRAELKSISDKRNEQKVITRDRIVIAKQGESEAGKRAKRVEDAPLVGECKTPAEVMQSGL
jgi:type II secretory pathway pseudopilin PulG